MFGELWLRNYGSSDTDDRWASALTRFTQTDIKHGIERLAESGKQFPPSLPEFIALCKKPPKHPSHKVYKALPVLRSDKETASEAIKGLRNAIRGGSQEDLAESE